MIGQLQKSPGFEPAPYGRIPLNPRHKNGETRPRVLKWAGLGGGQSWEFWRFDCQREYKETFFVMKDFRNRKIPHKSIYPNSIVYRMKIDSIRHLLDFE